MKKALIIGNKGLIGGAVYEQLAVDGFDVVGIDLPDYDFSDAAVISNTLRAERPEIVVNCAYPKQFDDHVSCLLNTAISSAVYLRNKGGGSVVSLASIYGMVGPQDDLYEGTGMQMPDEYSFIKGGIIAHTKCLASRYAPKVRVNCISPGGVFDNQVPQFVDRYVERTPLKRMATAQDIADAVSFLVSEKASYITGHNLVVDGGWTSI